MAFSSEIAIAIRRNPREALQVALSKLDELIAPPKGIQRVVIKPSIYDPELPGNTDAKIVQVVVQFFNSIGPISIVESDNPLRTAEEAFSRCGYLEFETKNVGFVNLTKTEMIPVQFAGYYFQNRKMPHILHDNMFLINIATLKVEPDICEIGASIKNLFGLLPELDKSVYHNSIDSVLMDLLYAYRPNLTVIDLTDVVIGNRINGTTKHVGGVIVGTDPVAVDSFCSSLLGIDPMQVNHLKIAHSLGMGETNLDRISVRGTEHQKAELSRLFKK